VFDTFRDENSIKMIATSLPKRLLKNFGKKEFYSPEEVKSVFLEVFDSDINIQYAYASFGSPKDFAELAQIMELSSSYSELRLKVAGKCFDGWPRFNFESFLNLSNDSSKSDLLSEITDIGLDMLSGG